MSTFFSRHNLVLSFLVIDTRLKIGPNLKQLPTCLEYLAFPMLREIKVENTVSGKSPEQAAKEQVRERARREEEERRLAEHGERVHTRAISLDLPRAPRIVCGEYSTGMHIFP